MAQKRKRGADSGLRQPVREERGPITHIDFHSWEQFKAGFGQELFGAGAFPRGRFLFRGHCDSNWRLTPTFDRMFAQLPRGKRLQISEDLFRQFKQALEPFDIPPEARDDNSMMRALGQHYGLPTRLLDWTESPYIAAFFAFNLFVIGSGSFGDDRIVIWALDSANPIWSSEYGVEIVDVPSFGNERIRNQAGKFTLSKTPYTSLEDYVEAFADEKRALIRFTIPAADSKRAIADLDSMGIHHASVFPEIVGSAQMALYRTVLRHEPKVERTPLRDR